MNLRAAFSLGLTLVGLSFAALASAAPAPSPWKPGSPRPGAEKPARTPVLLNGQVDRGQFLADTVVLCRVGPRVTTVADYVRLYFASYIEDRPASDSAGRVTFLDNIVAKDVLGLLALQINRPFGFEERATMREFEQRALSNALYRTAVMESLEVSEEEIAREYEQFRSEIHLRHMDLPGREAAERVRKDLISKKLTWQQAYDRYSLSKGKEKAPDGDIGWTVRGGATLDMSRRVFTLPAGAISEPIEQPDNIWDLVQVIEKRPGNPPGLSAVREYLRSQLAEEKTLLRARAVRDVVRRQIGMTFNEDQVAWAASHFQPVQTRTRDENGIGNLNFNTILPEFSAEDTSRVLAQFRGGVITLGRFFHQYTDIQPLLRPNVNTPEFLRDEIEVFTFEPYMAQVAKERGLDRDSTVLAQIAQKREELLVERLYSDSVMSRVSIDPRARRKYYQEHLSGFFTYAQVRFAAMWADSKEAADKLAGRLKAGEKAEEIIRADSLLGTNRGSIQTRSENDHGAPYQKLLFEGLRPGQISVEGPDKVGHYSVIQLLEFDPGRQLSYDEASGYIDESMQNLESEKQLKALVARHRKKWPIYERRDLVMQVKLVDPTL